MGVLTWDAVGNREYETGVDHGVLYVPDGSGDYNNGYAWNGLTTVTEKPSGGDANPQYADNMKYLNLRSAEQFGATLEAFMYPREFEPFDGLGVPTPGVTLGQQGRGVFGLSYRTRIGNDLLGDDFGYKLHLVYGLSATPSEKAYATESDSPAAINFSWDLSSVPVPVTGYKPTSIITINSTEVDATALADLETLLYGGEATEPRLPSPDEIVALFGGTVTVVTATAPTYNAATDTITIPTVTGVEYLIDGSVVTGDVVISEDTVVTARPTAGHVFSPTSDDDWTILHT